MFDIKAQLEKLPENPGVYIMKDSAGEIIYIGKAVVLKNRVRQYFQSYRNHTPKVRAMVNKISSFEYIVTDSEMEALILECNLIKRFRPRFNVLLKDDKSYPYIKVTMNEDYPRVLITRKYENDGAKYFGPYPNVYAVKQTIDMVKKIFPMRTCKGAVSEDNEVKKRPCLNYYIYQCLAPCQGNVNIQEYKKMMSDVCDLLGGKQQELISKLEQEMEEASKALEYEKAAQIRDKITSLRIISEKQKVSSSIKGDRDIIAYARDTEDICVEVFSVRGGNLVGRKHFFLENSEDENIQELLNSFIKQFYADLPFIPNEIIVQSEVAEAEMIKEWLTGQKGSKVSIKVPQKGEKLRLIEMAAKNAQLELGNLKNDSKYNEKKTFDESLKLLADLLELAKIPCRIEAYDVSNTGSSEMVAAMAVFQNGSLDRGNYRKFKIKSLSHQDDYGAMQEVIYRRFRRLRSEKSDGVKTDDSFAKMPDLLLIDGGIGHVTAVKTVLNEIGIDIPVWGMEKDDRHRTKSLVSNGKEIDLSKQVELLRFITKMQDEAHRLAVEYNRKLRNKRYTASVLDEIKGIGPSRKKALLRHFGSIKKIASSTIDELLEVEGLNKRVAVKVYDYFH